MGATVSVACAASAFQSRGSTYYVLFEETYKKNCYPHHPHWSCIYIGRQAEVLNRVFAYAADCEGGMLQNPGGHITPEGYIQRWMKALKQPLRLRDDTFTLGYGKGYPDAIRTDQAHQIEIIRSQGHLDIADGLVSGKQYILPLDEYGELLAQLCAGGVSAWRLLPGSKPRGEPDASLALDYAGAQASAYTPLIPSTARIENHVFIETDGVYRNEGWDYSIIGSFVANFWKTEIEYPGSYKTAIKAYRQALKDAPQAVDLGLWVHIDPDTPLQYGASNRKNLLALLGGRTELALTEALEILGPDGYQIVFGAQYVTLRRPEPALRQQVRENLPLFA